MGKYPVTLSIDYPGESDRIKVLFRLFLAIPILIILGLLTSSGYENPGAAGDAENFYSLGIVFLPALLMIVFRQKYPKWWFDWNLALTRFSFRVGSYFLLLRDEYPSTDEEQSVHLEIPYPDVKKDLNRWMPLVKWLLAIPHVIILAFLIAGLVICTFVTWFVILVTGSYPRGIFEFVVGTMRWYLRVYAYAFLLTTDVYPPFSLK